MSVFVDRTANMAAIDLQPGRPIARTEEVGTSLLANYDDADELVGVEVLSLKAVRRPEVVAELHVLLGPLGELSAGVGFAGTPALVIAPHRLNIVDLLIQQIDSANVEDGNALAANVLV
jgi:hypothetical protein